MKTKLFFLLLLISVACPLTAQVNLIKSDSFDSLKTISNEKQKGLILFIGANWNGTYHSMKKAVFGDEKVGNAVNPYFVTADVNAEKKEWSSVMRQLRIRAYPTLVFFNYLGEEVSRAIGNKDKEQFLELVRLAQEKLEN